MNQEKNFAIRERITRAITTGAVFMIIFFVVSLFLPKLWMVSGRVVVFPSGQPVSASQNLGFETGNTAEIIKGDSFQKNYFGDLATNFAGAKVLKNSSIVLVKFRSSENDIQQYEDAIVKIPSAISEYARDLYDGMPFKYKMAADPEISTSPVSPNLPLNAGIGFLAGVVLYLLYWLVSNSRGMVQTEGFPEMASEDSIVSPDIQPEESKKDSGENKDKSVGGGKVVIENGRPHFVPGKVEKSSEKMTITPRSVSGGSKAAAPANLPFVDEQDASPQDSSASSDSLEISEPTDEEVKERLNRLMRGEL
jgi:hypothetical protein